jgi:hypothetical protein
MFKFLGSSEKLPGYQDDDERLRELGYKPVLRRSWRRCATGGRGGGAREVSKICLFVRRTRLQQAPALAAKIV